jgi:hypothetical protein
MLDNPFDAQVTLLFAMNSYKDLVQKQENYKSRNEIFSNNNPYLTTALENLALFR